jgi:hypothetical protein
MRLSSFTGTSIRGIESEMATTAALATKTAWAVMGRDQRVRLILAGEDASAEAEEWGALGFVVLPVTL